jgi:hypothetical protein
VDSICARKVFGCQERAANQEVRGSEKKDERHAVYNDVLGELILRVVTPVSRGGLARRGGLAGRAQDLIGGLCRLEQASRVRGVEKLAAVQTSGRRFLAWVVRQAGWLYGGGVEPVEITAFVDEGRTVYLDETWS